MGTSRRNLLKLLAGAPLADATGMNPQKALARIGGAALLTEEDQAEEWVTAGDGGSGVNLYDLAWRATSRRPAYERDAMQVLPAHIATKKSWSVAFKVSCAVREEEEREALRSAIVRNRELAEKFCGALGVPLPEHGREWGE